MRTKIPHAGTGGGWIVKDSISGTLYGVQWELHYIDYIILRLHRCTDMKSNCIDVSCTDIDVLQLILIKLLDLWLT